VNRFLSLFLSVLLIFLPLYVEAQGLFSSPSSSDEEESKYEPNKDKDPFLPLLRKRRPKPPQELKPPTELKPPPPPEPVIPDLEMEVMCIVGNDLRRMAIVQFEGKILEITKNHVEPGAFKVVDISKDAVSVYSFRKKRRRIFKLPE